MKLLGAFILASTATVGFGQQPNVIDPRLEQVFALLETDQCEKANAIAIAAMEDPKTSHDDRGKFLWCRITSLAQMFIFEKISYEDLKLKSAQIPIGYIELPGYRSKSGNGLNFVSAEKENPNTLFIGEANKSGTYMFSMTRIKLAPGQKFVPADSSTYWISGQLTSLACHPYGRGSYVFRSVIENAIIDVN